METAFKSSIFARKSLLELGFLLATDKCQWFPHQQVIWLGHYLDMIEGKMFITEERISRLERAIDSLIYQIERDLYSLIHVRVLASVIGQIISLQNVIGKKVRLMTREMYSCILSRASWNAPVVVTDKAKAELLFWRKEARILNNSGKTISKYLLYEACLFADASNSGYGGYIEMYENALEVGKNEFCKKNTLVPPEEGKLSSRHISHVQVDHVSTKIEDKGTLDVQKKHAFKVDNKLLPNDGSLMHSKSTENMIIGPESKSSEMFGLSDCVRSENRSLKPRKICAEVIGDWDSSESAKSSTWREPETVRRVIKSSVEILKNKQVKVYSDNKNVQSILQIGSKRQNYRKLLLILMKPVIVITLK